MPLLQTIDQLKIHVTVGFNFRWNVIAPHVIQAERDALLPVLGNAFYTFLNDNPPENTEQSQALELLREASACLAVARYIPQGSLHISNAGMSVSSGENHKPAQWWQLRDLQRSLYTQGHSAIDQTLALMESTAEAFSLWVNSPQYTVFKELLTPQTADFNRHFPIQDSRRSFVALRPYLLEVQRQYFAPWLSQETLDRLGSGGSAQVKQARDYAQAAQVNFTIAKAAATGVFHFSSSGLTLKNEELPGDKTQMLSELALQRIVDQRIQTAQEYLKMLKQYLLEHPDAFPEFEVAQRAKALSVVHTKSVVGF